ncbi:MAG: right-handed parallel beta-helix repeat-containing protein [Candidatus Lokiarchaeota archaeon]|nr:right-handed parallel beta-helix repeat-containing protein [Candidatus Lokiarchaeota archaeon]
MKTKSYYFKVKLSLILSILLIIFAVNKIPFDFEHNLHTVKLDDMKSSGKAPVNPIFINDTDPDYSWSKTAADNDWCSGSGSWGDPYVIKNITINGNSSSNCIEIHNSYKYFIIKNCTVYNSSIGYDFAGITLENVNNSLIFENNCSYNNGHGIHLTNSFNVTLLHNLAQNNIREGIFLRLSANNTVRNNTVVNNHRGIRVNDCGANNIIDNNSVYENSEDPINSAGIGIYFSHNTTITRNNIFNNTKGIYFTDTSNITLKGNIMTNNQMGTHLESSNNNIKFIDNILNNCNWGISLSSIKESIVKNNTIFSCESGIIIQNTENISLFDNNIINCSNQGIEIYHNNYDITIAQNNLTNCDIYLSPRFEQISTYNISISNLINGKPVYFYTNEMGLTASNFSNPGQIILFNCNNTFISNLTVFGGGSTLLFCHNNTLLDNVIQGQSYGLRLDYCHNNTLFNNTIFDSRGAIYLYRIEDGNITENELFNNGCGIQLDLECFNINVSKNIIRDNIGGLSLQSSENNNFTLNRIYNNTIGIYNGESGNYNNYFFNDILNNSWDGIRISYSSNNNLFGNNIHNNNERGLAIDSFSNNHLIFNNTFVGNSLNAQDNGTNNQWDNGAIGNFWDDYIGYDLNGDGIGDTPYNISGLAKCVDRFPQIIKLPPQIIIESPHTNELFGYNPPEIELTIISPNIDTIWYFLSNETKKTNNYNFTGEIEQNIWNSIGNGSLNIEFYANNSYGLIGSSEVQVRKDIISPQIIIYSPTENQEFTVDTPFFNISVIEPNLESIWYTIDGGITNHTFTSLTDTIDEAAWDTISEGSITITFFARDTVGNIGSESVVVIKITPSTEGGIPGFNIFLIIGTISVISLFILKKKFK